MWGVGGLIDMIVVLALVYRALGGGERVSAASRATRTPLAP
jgi:hypothetical protein